MKVIDLFKGRAHRAEKHLDALANEQHGKLAQSKRLHQLERRFMQMAADGHIDPKEMRELRKMMKAAGLSTKQIDGLYQKMLSEDGIVESDKGSDFRDLVSDTLRSAQEENRDDMAQTNYSVQVGVMEFTHSRQMAMNLSKKEHDAQMAAIRHLVA